MNDAPVTNVFSLEAPLQGNNNVGLLLSNDELGFESTLNISGIYAYEFNFGKIGNLRLGAGISYFNKALDGSELRPEEENDFQVPLNSVSETSFDFNFGLYYQNQAFYNLYVGLGAKNLTEPSFEYEVPQGIAEYELLSNYNLMMGIEYPLSASFSLQPNLLLKTDFIEYQTDININAVYNNRFRLGASYRTEDAFSMLLGYRIFDNLNLGYSYDFTTSDLNTVSSGSHEVFLRYCLTMERAKPPVKLSPRYF